jgi:hypothetical protein
MQVGQISSDIDAKVRSFNGKKIETWLLFSVSLMALQMITDIRLGHVYFEFARE